MSISINSPLPELRDELNVAQSRFNEVQMKIYPLLPNVTEADDVKAHMRIAINEIIFSLIPIQEVLTFAISKCGEATEDLVISEKAKKALDFTSLIIDSDSSNIWEDIFSKDRFSSIKDGLSQPHDGDCTAKPYTCSRCLAEMFYSMERTAKWSKAEGHSLAYEIQHLQQKITKLIDANDLNEKLVDKGTDNKKGKT